MKRRNFFKKLDFAITKAIDNLCEESDYEITYAEINSVLAGTIKRNYKYVD